MLKVLGINIQIRTVDGCQGEQKAFVILDTTTPRSARFSLGFLENLNGRDVSLSRAKNGSVVVGWRFVADDDYPNGL